MKVTREKIGKIQFYFGIVLFVLTIFSAYYIVNYYIEQYSISVSSKAEAWAGTIGNVDKTLANALFVSDITTMNTLVSGLGFIFVLGVAILTSVSILFVLQGLANMKKEK